VSYTQQTGNGTSTQLVQISNKLKGGYRFGYNGQEKDNEVAGEGNEIEFKYRLYDPRIGKFKSADPLHKSYPWNSDYAFAENRVIDGIDLEGLEFYYAADGTVLRKNGDNIQVMLVNNDFVSKTAYASIEQLNKNSTNIGMTNYELNARAFLTMIRKGEGTLGFNGYKAQFAGKQFNDFSDHPNLVVNSGKYSSSASGAYQVLSKTWNSKAGENAKKGLGIKDFSPESQDKFGLWLISNRNALGDVIDGNVRGAIGKTNKEWASLPGSPYGQPTQTLEGALQNFKGAVSKELNGKSEIATPKGDLEKTIKTLKK
jgi:RHS repeat-associated protein